LTNQSSISIDQLYNRRKTRRDEEKGIIKVFRSRSIMDSNSLGSNLPSTPYSSKLIISGLFWLTGSRELIEIYDRESEIKT